MIPGYLDSSVFVEAASLTLRDHWRIAGVFFFFFFLHLVLKLLTLHSMYTEGSRIFIHTSKIRDLCPEMRTSQYC